MEIEASALSSLCLTISENKTNKNKENFKSNLVLVMTLQSKGLYCCILTSRSTIVSQQ